VGAVVVALGVITRSAAASDEMVLGEVREVYIRSAQSRQLYLQQGVRWRSSEPMWVEVVPRVQDARPILAVLSAGMEVAPRDIVELRVDPPEPRAVSAGPLPSAFDEVGGSPGAPTGTVTRIVERRGIVRKEPELKLVVESGRLFVRVVLPVDPTAPPTALAHSAEPEEPRPSTAAVTAARVSRNENPASPAGSMLRREE
jgi:hypothetical protein